LGVGKIDYMITAMITIGGVHGSSIVCTFELQNLSEIFKSQVNYFVNLMPGVPEKINNAQRTTVMADQHTTELAPQQEHSLQLQPTNETKPKGTTCNPRTPK
jgi:hypothetical protein